jgi:raffinose/stachyose/melibiose transport system substrate-binding protein
MRSNRLTRIVCLAVIAVFLLGTFLTGCGSKNDAAATTSTTEAAQVASTSAATDATAVEEAAKPATIRINYCSTVGDEAYKKYNLIDEYKKIRPNVTIELEKSKDDLEQLNTLKMQRSAGNIPDIVQQAGNLRELFQDNWASLDGIDCVTKNTVAANFKVNGQILGIPEGAGYGSLVYYNKDIFTEYNLAVPQTWNELIAAAQKIKDGGKYIPVALGGKDVWPVFPYTESGPFLISADTDTLSKMTTVDDPFSKGGATYTAYSMFKRLADIKPFGPDVLGTDFNQSKTMVGAKKAAMFFCAQWALNDVKTSAGDNTASIGCFFMPFRENATDPLNILVGPGSFWYVNKASAAVDECKNFLNWYFSPAFEPNVLAQASMNSLQSDITMPLDPIIQGAVDAAPNATVVTFDTGNGAYASISALAKFDTKVVGPKILAGQDFDKVMADYNAAWKEARAQYAAQQKQ